jgi:hypothetical protein
MGLRRFFQRKAAAPSLAITSQAKPDVAQDERENHRAHLLAAQAPTRARCFACLARARGFQGSAEVITRTAQPEGSHYEPSPPLRDENRYSILNPVGPLWQPLPGPKRTVVFEVNPQAKALKHADG